MSSDFLFGAAAGLAVYRLIIALVSWSDPDHSIAHCMWCHKKDCPRFKHRQSR